MNINKIHILYIIDGLHPGGKERQFIEILKGINRNDFKIGIVTFNKDLFYTKQAKELTDYYVELDKSKNKFKPFITIWKCFRQFKPDIIHTWDYLSSLYGYIPSRIKRVKFIDGSIRDSGTEKGWQAKVKWIMLRLADLALANSKAGLKNYGIKKGEVIYNAVDLNRFLPKLICNEFNIIKVANFSDYKDHLMFTKAAIELVEKEIVDNVYFAGDGIHRKKCEKLVNNCTDSSKSKFHFLGRIKNVEEYLQKCTVGVLCSTTKYSEGISNSILEYIAASLVPIATDIGGSSEIITDGENGFLVEPELPEGIVKKVMMIKSQPEIITKISLEAKKTLEDKFNYKKNIEKVSNLYKKILKRI